MTTAVVKVAGMNLGGRIKLVREELGWKAGDLCDRVEGLTQQAVSALETRDSKTSEFAIRIADALQVSVRWLLDGTGRRDDKDWPFTRVSRRRWDACNDGDRGYIEGAMNRALDDCPSCAQSANELSA